LIAFLFQATGSRAAAAARKLEALQAEHWAALDELAAAREELARLKESNQASSRQVQEARQQQSAAVQKMQQTDQRCRGLSGEVASLRVQLQVRVWE
jgi:predicted  nucleic acid-binding Zn-ribbon protein